MKAKEVCDNRVLLRMTFSVASVEGFEFNSVSLAAMPSECVCHPSLWLHWLKSEASHTILPPYMDHKISTAQMFFDDLMYQNLQICVSQARLKQLDIHPGPLEFLPLYAAGHLHLDLRFAYDSKTPCQHLPCCKPMWRQGQGQLVLVWLARVKVGVILLDDVGLWCIEDGIKRTMT